MQLVSDPSTIQENAFLARIYDSLGFKEERSMLIASGISVIILLTLSNIGSVLTTWFQQKYSWNVLHNTSTRLLKKYLHRPYNFFLKENSSRLLTNLTSEVGLLCSGILLPSIQLISKILLVIIIAALLIAVNPMVALLMFLILSSTYYLIFASRKNYLKKIGHQRIQLNRKKFKHADEALKGIKTLMIYNKRNFFFNRFVTASKKHSLIAPSVSIISTFPKYIIEVVAFSCIVLIILVQLSSGKNVESIIPLLSLYALAAYRLLPAFQVIFSNLTKLRHNLPTLDTLYNDLKESETITRYEDVSEFEKIQFEHQVEVSQLGFQYDEAISPTLNAVDITIQKGKTVAFVGSTGSGKTTLIDILVGLLAPKSGSISIDDQVLDDSMIRSWQNEISYVPQDVFLYDDSISNNIAFGVSEEIIDHEKISHVAKLVNLHQFITEDLANQYETTIGENGVRLSGGQRQRLGLARALYRNPSVLVLDEATSALDGVTENIIIESLKNFNQDLTVIIIAHRLATVKHADNIYFLKNGKIDAQGTYEQLLSRSSEFRKMAELS